MESGPHNIYPYVISRSTYAAGIHKVLSMEISCYGSVVTGVDLDFFLLWGITVKLVYNVSLSARSVGWVPMDYNTGFTQWRI